MKLTIKFVLTVFVLSNMTIMTASEAGSFSSKLKSKGNSSARNFSSNRSSSSKFRGNSNSSFSRKPSSNFRKPTSNRFQTPSNRYQNLKSKFSDRTNVKPVVRPGSSFDRTRPVDLKKNVQKKSSFKDFKPGDGGRKTIMPVDPKIGHKPKHPGYGYGNDIIFPTPRPRPRPPVFCPPGRRPIVCLPPINICPPVYTPCVTTTCQQIIVEPALIEQPVQEELEPVLQLVVGQPAALEANGLGQTAGQVIFEVNGLGLPAKVTQWEDALLAMEVPMMGLQGPTNALMHLIGADGQPIASVPVELLMEAPQVAE